MTYHSQLELGERQTDAPYNEGPNSEENWCHKIVIGQDQHPLVSIHKNIMR